MKNIKFIIFCIVALAIVSCDSILDTEPKQDISEELALTNSSNVEAVLVGAYNELGDNDVWGGRMMMLPDLLGVQSGNGDMTWSGTFEQPRQVFFKNIRVDNTFIAAAWSEAYEVINIANNVLSALDVVDSGIKDRVEGEALFLRGSMYFELARQFGKAWNDGDPSTNLAVPLITEPTREIGENSQVPRNTVQEIYNQAISDLTTAKGLLPESNGVFANSYSAGAMLARLYLQQQNYDAARTEANEVIESGQFSLVEDYSGVFNNSNNNTTEDIFAMQVTNQDGTNDLNTFYAADLDGGRGDIEINQVHLDKYEAGDERLGLFYTDPTTGDNRTGKWQNQFGNVLVLRLAEMYLIRAEANFQEGTPYTGPNTPTDDVNVIRNRAGLADLGSVTLQDILDERFLELAFEGHFLHDTKRSEGSVGSTPWDADILVYPVPLREINANPSLQQNSGYGGSG